MFWGFSECLDFYEEYVKSIKNEPKELNVLLFGSGDPRNIMKTIAKSYKHDAKINFYVIDGTVELIARNLILLSIALENSEEISLLHKVHLFMDVYGNTLLRPFSHYYVMSKAETLRKVITDSVYLDEVAPSLRIENLKYRERDGLEEVFNFYQPREGHIFNIKKNWDDRVRHLLGVRYDNRDGVFDWDLQMKLKDTDAKQICPQEYKVWRDKGIAFTFPEFEQSCANKTLALGLARNGTNYYHKGYLGDIEVGPFCTFGLKTGNEKMLKSFHGTNDYRATDVTKHNLHEILYEIQEKQEYKCDDIKEQKYGGIIFQLGENLSASETSDIQLKKYEKPFISTPNIKIIILSPEDAIHLQDGSKFQNFFDIVFVSNKYFPIIKNKFQDMFNENCLLMFETKVYSVLKKDEIEEFQKKILELAKNFQLENVTNFNINLKYSVIKFKNKINENA